VINTLSMIFENPKKLKGQPYPRAAIPLMITPPAVLPAMSLKDMLRTSREQTKV
jgi:hypothetical protein